MFFTINVRFVSFFPPCSAITSLVSAFVHSIRFTICCASIRVSCVLSSTSVSSSASLKMTTATTTTPASRYFGCQYDSLYICVTHSNSLLFYIISFFSRVLCRPSASVCLCAARVSIARCNRNSHFETIERSFLSTNFDYISIDE